MPVAVSTEADDMPDDLQSAQAEPSLESLISSIMGGGQQGWADLDAKNIGALMRKQMDMQRAKLRKEALVFRECFATVAGRKVLETLLEQTLRRTAWPVHAMTDAQMLMAHGIWREAENSFVAAIIETLAYADNTELKPRSEP